MKNYLLIGLGCLFIGCTSHSNGLGQMPAISYPASWPKLMQKDFGKNECATLNGVYLSGGRSNSTLGDRFIKPIFERNFFGLDNIDDENNRFSVVQDSESKVLQFEFYDQEGRILESGLYKNYSRCESGWLINESQVRGGTGDNPTKSQTEFTRRYLAEDGSLIINTTLKVVTRKLIFGSETKVSDIWYRFEKVKTGIGDD